MAIIIPSKSIYQKDNQKILKNKIDKTTINCVTPVVSNDYDIVADTKTITIQDSSSLLDTMTSDVKYRSGGVVGGYSCAYVEANTMHIRNYEISSIKAQKDLYSRISNIYIGEDSEGEANIKFSVKCAKYEYSGANAQVDFSGTIPSISNIMREVGTPTITHTNETFETFTVSASATQIKASVTRTSETNLSDLTITKNSSVFTINENAIILCGKTELSLSGNNYSYDIFTITGTYTKYIPESIEISFYGDVIGIDLEDSEIVVGSGNNVFSLESNELMQSTNYYETSATNALQRFGRLINSHYAKGKELATIRCSIVDYYDNSATPVLQISTTDTTKPMCFEVYDEVIPYVRKADGSDTPLSYYSDGTPKVFVVLGVKPIFDGALWQELTLQEKLQSA